MQRELTDEQVAEQVARLADYVRRGGDPRRWLLSKFFRPGDQQAIEDAYANRRGR